MYFLLPIIIIEHPRFADYLLGINIKQIYSARYMYLWHVSLCVYYLDGLKLLLLIYFNS